MEPLEVRIEKFKEGFNKLSDELKVTAVARITPEGPRFIFVDLAEVKEDAGG